MLVKELEDQVQVRIESYQQKLRRFYSKKISLRKFQTGDLVHQGAFELEDKKKLNAGKLGTSCEGSYTVREVVGKGTYRLSNAESKLILRTWNTLHLKKCFA